MKEKRKPFWKTEQTWTADQCLCLETPTPEKRFEFAENPFLVKTPLSLSPWDAVLPPLCMFFVKSKGEAIFSVVKEVQTNIFQGVKKWNYKWLFTFCSLVPDVSKELFKQFGSFTNVTSLQYTPEDGPKHCFG